MMVPTLLNVMPNGMAKFVTWSDTPIFLFASSIISGMALYDERVEKAFIEYLCMPVDKHGAGYGINSNP